ncbi:efflux RND transporter periplasmic adaptor subunit [Sulfuricaulis sp.]|uniref:efflux RND transporter periplasmic adaptor subunit n=1 Tax=Sulfuricaulis sp. TaxID=2003553 RepID=UPI0026009020|nr:efflux RND transporter periplasmic adaptor subunit [Sulfuricaulis sp.]
MNRKTKLTVTAGAVVVLGIAVGWYFLGSSKSPVDIENGVKTERQILYWTDPMVPGYRSDTPGKSPFMDMDLVPVYADEAGGSGAPVITVRPEFIQNFGVRTHKVTKGGAVHTITAQGYLFRDSSGLRVLLDTFDREMNWVRAGLPAEIRVTDFPGRQWNGTVESVKSDVDVGTRSLKASIRITNPDAVLKPNMYAEVIIRDLRRHDQKIMVPTEALIRTGFRTALLLALGGGRFQPIEVVPGEESGDWIEIHQGIKEGDVVVTSGQFLIDSEASVRASFQRMESAPADPQTGNQGNKP